MKPTKNDPSLNKVLPFIFSKALDPIVVYQPVRSEKGEIIDFTVRFLNDSAVNFIKGSREDYIGKSLLSIFPNFVKNGRFAAYKSVVETGIALDKDFYFEFGNYKGWLHDSAVSYDEGIIVYFKDVTKRKEFESKLQKTVKEKEILLREINHRVKNNLQMVASILSLQSENVKYPEVAQIFVESQNRIKAIALIHHKLYEGKSFASVNFESYIDELIKTLFNAYHVDGKIKLVCDIDKIEANTDSAINLGLILNELITNALKYAFPGNKPGDLIISIKQGTDNITIIVADNGIGFPKDVDFRNGDSLGMQLVVSLTEQNQGEIELDKSNGTKFTLTFDKNIQK